jgi:hypothetical protein
MSCCARRTVENLLRLFQRFYIAFGVLMAFSRLFSVPVFPAPVPFSIFTFVSQAGGWVGFHLYHHCNNHIIR